MVIVDISNNSESDRTGFDPTLARGQERGPAVPWEGINSATSRRQLGVVCCAILLDATLIWLSFCLAYYFRYVVRWIPVERGTTFLPFSAWENFGRTFTLIQVTCLILMRTYRLRMGSDLFEEVLAVSKTALIGIGIVAIVTAFQPGLLSSRFVFVYAGILMVPMLAAGRVVLRSLTAQLHARGWNARNVLVVGTSPLGKLVMQNLLAKRRQGFNLVGFLQEPAPEWTEGAGGSDFGRFKCLGSLDEMQRVMLDHHVDEVIVALPASRHERIARICTACDSSNVSVRLVPDLFQLSLGRVDIDHLAGIPLITVRQQHGGKLVRAVKRLIDLSIACVLLILLMPLLLLTALAIKLDSPGPVLANQVRVGKGGKHFRFFKFRSMRINAEAERDALAAQHGVEELRIFKLRNDPRRTRVGKIIRRLSIDEIPQLFNVLLGDMSLVGPRPPLPSEVNRYQAHHLRRLEVVGGITGLWQVSGRSNIDSFEEIIIMDTYYIDNWSLSLDLKILLRTIWVVLTRNGAY